MVYKQLLDQFRGWVRNFQRSGRGAFGVSNSGGLVLGYEITLACICGKACSYWIGAHETSIGKTN